MRIFRAKRLQKTTTNHFKHEPKTSDLAGSQRSFHNFAPTFIQSSPANTRIIPDLSDIAPSWIFGKQNARLSHFVTKTMPVIPSDQLSRSARST